MPPFVIYLTHHSHCDLGYTHDLPIIRELQRRSIDEALDLVDKHAGADADAAFRWTCEVTCVVEHWLRTASSRQVARFVEAAERGRIEVCALWSNLTPLATIAQHAEMLEPIRRLREELGLPIRAAMNSDVNGFSWALAGLLAEAGIEGLTMSINEHFGGAPQPFPGLFRWRTPSGGTLPVWSGPTYAQAAWLGLCGEHSAARTRLAGWIARQQALGWQFPWLAMQITHHGPQNDNMGPIAHLSPWIAEFNARHGNEIRLVLTTPSRFFASVGSDAGEAEVRAGEWNDWWAFGVGSTPFETALFRRASARLEEADMLGLVERPRNYSALRDEAHQAMAHFIEHTWGADCAVHLPAAEDTRIQARHKDHFAYDSFSAARLLRRDGLGALADRVAGPDGPALLVFNPTTQTRRETLRVPRRFLEASNLPAPASPAPLASRRWPRDSAYQHFVDREVFGGEPVDELGPVELPPLGWRVITAAHRAARAETPDFSGHRIGNGRVSLSWSPEGFGLSSLKSGDRDWAESGPVSFGALICEEVLGDRGVLMKFDDSMVPETTRRPVWNSTPPLRRCLPTNVSSHVERTARTIRLVQRGSLPHTAGIETSWRLFADHDDVEVTVTIQKLPEARPHALYFALPFAVPAATRLASVAGLVINPSEEALPNGCPWWSLQEGFAIGDAQGTACVAAPDAPMTVFQRLPLGASQIGGAALDHPGLAFGWIYNNYWETNFRADDSGQCQFRFRIAFSDEPPNAAALLALGSRARHPLAYHPLPEPSDVPPTWPDTGSLFSLESATVHLSGCLPDASPGAARLVLVNTAASPGDCVLRGNVLRISRAETTSPEGRPLGAVPVTDGECKVTVAPRATLLLRVETN